MAVAVAFLYLMRISVSVEISFIDGLLSLSFEMLTEYSAEF
jgi:hypothetical protein